jgi:hypothetical protein
MSTTVPTTTPVGSPSSAAAALHAISFTPVSAGGGGGLGTGAGGGGGPGTGGTTTTTVTSPGGTLSTMVVPPAPTGPATFMPPLFGDGTSHDTVWTGGTIQHPRMVPASVSAYRPNTYRDRNRLEAHQKTDLQLNKHLHLQPGVKVGSVTHCTLTSTMMAWKGEAIQCGTESCFVIYDPLSNTERCLFDNYGRLDVRDGQKMVEDICINRQRVKDPSGPGNIRLPVCPYEVENMGYSGFMIKNSLTPELLNQVEKTIGIEPHGITALLACVTAIQNNSSPAYCKLIKELETLRLTNEPGQDVHAHSDKVEDLAKRIEVVPGLCSDIITLVCATFVGSCNKMFDAKVIAHYNDADTAKSVGWEEIIKDLKNAYDKELGLNSWGAAAKTKAEAEAQRTEHEFKALMLASHQAEMKALTSAMNALQQTVKSLSSKPPGTAGAVAGSTGEGKTKKDRDPGGFRRIPPQAGEPHIKVIDGVTLTWCEKCGWWTKGTGMHSTATHVSKKDKALADAAATSAGGATGASALQLAAQPPAIQGGAGLVAAA